MLKEDQGPKQFKLKSLYCFVMTFIILLPQIIGIALFQLISTKQPFILSVEQGEGTKITASSIGAVDTFSWSNIDDAVYGFVDENCESTDPEKFQLVNQKQKECPERLTKNNIKGIIYIDPTPERSWRVSSPHMTPLPHLTRVSVIRVREVDWDLAMKTVNITVDQQIAVLQKNYPDPEDLRPLLSCSNTNQVIIGKDGSEKLSAIKYLEENGTVIETQVFDHVCYKNGQKCEIPRRKHTTVNIACKTKFSKPVTFHNIADGGLIEMSPNKIKLPTGSFHEMCCRNETNRIEIYGDDCMEESVNLSDICQFTKYFAEGEILFSGYQTLQIEQKKLCY